MCPVCLNWLVFTKFENGQHIIVLLLLNSIMKKTYINLKSSILALFFLLLTGNVSFGANTITANAVYNSSILWETAIITTGYPVQWADLEGVVVNSDGNLEKTEADGWGNAGAASTSGLAAGTDGWVEFQTLDKTSRYMVGLSPENIDSHWLTQRHSIFIHSDGTYRIYEGGISRINLGAYLVGDVFKIERAGNTIKYLRNGTVVYTSQVQSEGQLLVDVSIHNTGDVISDVHTSFNTPYVPVNKMGYPVQWVDVEGSLIRSDGSLEKTEVDGWGNAGAASSYGLQSGTDGWIEFQVFNRTSSYMVALSPENIDSHYLTQRYSIHIRGDGKYRVFEGGISRTNLAEYLIGDVFRIERTGNTIKYLRNGTAFYTSSVHSAVQLLVDISLPGTGTVVSDVRTSFNEIYSEVPKPGYFVQWTDVIGAVATNGGLEKTAVDGWGNSGAASKHSLVPGEDGWVEFQTFSRTKGYMIGLSEENLDSDYGTLQYAIQLAGDGRCYIRENGIVKLSLGPYLIGETFRIERIANAIKFLREGSVVYTSTISSVNSLLVDVSMYNIETELKEVRSSFSNSGEATDIFEIAALRDLYESTNGATWTNNTGWPTDWSTITSIDQVVGWHGISIENGDVTGIDLNNNNLVNSLPGTLKDLKGLKILQLHQNQLTGDVPDLGELNLLEELYLSNNTLSTIPAWISGLPVLRELSLENCQLTEIPEWLGTLNTLQYLSLQDNPLVGAIPGNLGNLINLQQLHLGDCSFTGLVPQEIINLTNLQYLTLTNNQLEGELPAFPSDSMLKQLKIEGNKITALPVVKVLSGLELLQVSNTLITFADIENNMPDESTPQFLTFTYAPQELVIDPVTMDYIIGTNHTIINSRAGGVNTSYQWEIWNGTGWEPVAGATSADLTLTNAGVDQNGKAYRCKMTNSVITDLTIYSTETVLNAIVSINYYTVADGDWNDPAIWSESSGGAPANAVPTRYDKVIIEGHNVSVASEVECREININALQTGKIEISGTEAYLIVNGEIIIEGPAEKGKKMLVVNNGGKIECK